MKVAVTGGAGFLGSWIGDALRARGHLPTAIDNLSGGFRRNVNRHWTLANIDLRDHEELDAYFKGLRPELVIHAAAFPAEVLSHHVRRFNYETNVIGFANVVNASVRHGVRKIVALSSIAVYGSQLPPFPEDLAPKPEDPYGIAKYAMEMDLRVLGETHGMEWVVVRPHNVYGPRQSMNDPYRNVVAIFMRQALAGHPITVYGDGTQTRAFSYVEDVAGAIVDLSVKSFTRRIFNIGGDQPISVLDLAHRVRDLLGSDSEIIHLPERNEVKHAHSAHYELKQAIAWDPTPIDTGLERTAEWARTVEIKEPRRYSYEMTEGLPEVWL